MVGIVNTDFNIHRFKEQDRSFGFFGSIAYNYGSTNNLNVYVGGARDFDENDDRNKIDWRLSIVRLKDDATIDHQGTMTSWSRKRVDYKVFPYISILYVVVRNTNQYWTYGATRNLNFANDLTAETGIFFWRLNNNGDLGTGGADKATYTYGTIQNWTGNSYVVSMRSNLVNEKDCHMILHMTQNGVDKLFYYVVDMTNMGTLALVELYDNQAGNLWASAAFYGTTGDTSITGDYTVYMAYIATSITQTNGSKMFSVESGAVLPTLFDAENCLTSPNRVTTLFTDDTVEVLTIVANKFDIIDPTTSGWSVSTTDGVVMIDINSELLDDQSWCSTLPTVVSVSTGGLVDSDTIKCVWGNNKVIEYPFIPFVVTDPAGCSDAADYFTYKILTDSAWPDSGVAQITADPVNAVIRLELGA